MPPKFRLFVDKITSIGAVPAGDNPEAAILFSKRKFDTEDREQAAERGAALPDGSFPILNERDLRNAIRAVGRAKHPEAAKRHIVRRARALGATDLLPDTWMSKDIAQTTRENLMDLDLSALDDETRTGLEEFVAEVERQRDDALAEIAKLREAGGDDSEPVEKELPDDVQLLIKERDDKITALEDEIAKSKADARLAEFVAKAADLEVLLGNPDEVGPVLRDIADAAPDAAGKLENMLTAAAQKPELAALFKELGETAPAEDVDAVAKRDQWVADYLEKHEAVTIHQARAEFWKTHPDLVGASRDGEVKQ